MARVYRRDSRGRFASGGGGSSRPPARQAPRGTNRLTRDNAGRITSVGGNGATARGGRLRTAAGNQRATQTTRLASQRTGRVATPKAGGRVNVQQGRATAASRGLERGTFVRANLRPRNVMAKPGRGDNPFGRFAGPKHAEANLKAAESWAQQRGIKTYRFDGNSRSDGTGKRVAEAMFGEKTMGFNVSDPYWQRPKGATRDGRRSGWWSSSSPAAVLWHEVGHTRDSRTRSKWINAANAGRDAERNYNSWKSAVRPGLKPAAQMRRSWQMRDVARRVSGYAATSPAEFIAETYAGRKTGRRYDYQVMQAYREALGLPKTSVRRTIRSRRRAT